MHALGHVIPSAPKNEKMLSQPSCSAITPLMSKVKTVPACTPANCPDSCDMADEERSEQISIQTSYSSAV